jgi:N6-adenosine-specific RNA methylase IME4
VLLGQQVARTFPTGPYVVTKRFEDLPKRHYGLISADPAWQFGTWDHATAVTARGTKEHYKTQTLEEIAAVPVGSIAAVDCVLILWFLQPLLPPALEIVKHWGFTFKTLGPIWGKTTKDGDPGLGMGYWLRSGAEASLLATRGHPKRLDRGVRQLVLEPPRRGQHSRKPDRIYGDLERLTAGPYCELWATQAWPQWSAWGDQIGKYDGPRLAPMTPLRRRFTAAPRSISTASFSSPKWRSAKASWRGPSSAMSRRKSSRRPTASPTVTRGGGSPRWSGTTVRLPPNRRRRARRRTPGRKSRASALAGFRRKTEVM